MPVSISAELDAAEAQERLRDLIDRLDNRLPFFREIGVILEDSARARFRDQKVPDGAAWQPLRPATIRARKKRKQTPITILKARGHLAGSVNYIATNDEIRIGATSLYAAIHQLGGTIEKPAGRRWMAGRRFARKSEAPDGSEVMIAAHSITIPARPFLGVSATDREGILEDAADWLGL